MFSNPPDSVIREILATSRRIAVVGCSDNPARDSHRVALLLRQRGHTVFAVNPRLHSLFGEPSYSRLTEVPPPVEMVDIFRRAEHAGAAVDDAIAIGAKIVWLQLGVIAADAALRAKRAGCTVVMDRCPAIEYRRLFDAVP